MQLRPYQEQGVLNTSRKLAAGTRRVLLALATGGGKTVMFSAIASRYVQKSGKAVLIVVHREELLNQTRRTLLNSFSINSQPIVAGMATVPVSQVYVGMIESVITRLDRLYNVGMVIIDEAHRADFFKIHEHFPSEYILGFTATPQSANRKKPLTGYFDDIVTCVDIPELIELNNAHPGTGLCQNITYAPKDVVERATLKVTAGEFNNKDMADAFAKPRYVNNTVQAYERYAPNTKAIVFNCNISHSIAVAQAFTGGGYQVRHLDGGASKQERARTLAWFKTTPDSILCSCDILTAGFDEPSVETVIVNRATMSMPLWIQMTGRGSRPTPTKSMFTIIDMGDNGMTHGDWNMPRDWETIFRHPPKPSKGGTAPIKICVSCEAMIPAGAALCAFCNTSQPVKERAPETPIEAFTVITKGINVEELVNSNRHRKEYYPFFEIGTTLAKEAKRTLPHMDDAIAAAVLARYDELAKEWCAKASTGREKRINYNTWHKEKAKEHLFTELEKRFKTWKQPV